MRNVILPILLIFIFMTSIEGFEPITGNIVDYRKSSDWDTNKHTIEFFADIPEGRGITLTMHLDVQEMFEFNVAKGSKFLLLDERPDSIVGKSKFCLQFENDAKMYNAEGPTLQLKLSDWGLDETTFMVTQITPPYLIINSERQMLVADIKDIRAGQIFHLSYRNEEFIPDNPGMSYFKYVSLDNESSFKAIDPSINSHWKPSNEQMKNIVTVKHIGKYTVGMSGHIIGIGLSDGNIINLGEMGTPLPTWTQVGNRWLKLQDMYIDLDSGVVIKGATPIRTIQKNW